MGCGRPLAAVVVLAVVAALQGLPVLAAYNVFRSERAAGPNAPPREQAFGPKPRAGEHHIPSGARKRHRRVAQLFGGWFPDSDRQPSPPAGDPPRRHTLPTAATYRTMCVRLCDGYYFPISFTASRARLARDARACESRCGSEARLFIYRNPGGEPEDMTDLQGRPYRALPNAFVYRAHYNPSCKCQPHPWEAAAHQRHQSYALAAVAREGNKRGAGKQPVQQGITTQRVQIKTGTEASGTGPPPRDAQPVPAALTESAGDGQDPRAAQDSGKRGRHASRSMSRQDELVPANGGEAVMMRLGQKHKGGTLRSGRATADDDWRRRVFQSY